MSEKNKLTFPALQIPKEKKKQPHFSHAILLYVLLYLLASLYF